MPPVLPKCTPPQQAALRFPRSYISSPLPRSPTIGFAMKSATTQNTTTRRPNGFRVLELTRGIIAILIALVIPLPAC